MMPGRGRNGNQRNDDHPEGDRPIGVPDVIALSDENSDDDGIDIDADVVEMEDVQEFYNNNAPDDVASDIHRLMLVLNGQGTRNGAEAIYRLPPIQRPYEWKPSMAASLMKCVYEAWMSSTSPNDIYHMGSIILWNPDSGRNARASSVDKNPGHSENIIYLMDGQQRVTTLYLIFALIRHYMSKRARDDSRLFRLYRDHGWMVSSLTSLYTPLPMLCKILGQSISLICVYVWTTDIWIRG